VLASLHSYTLQQLENLPKHVKLVVIHPKYRRQRWVLSSLLPDALYVCFRGADLTLDQLEAQFHESSRFIDTNSESVSWIVLDECDRAQEESLDDLLRKLVGVVQDGHVVVFGRSVPACVRRDPAIRSLTAIIPTDETSALIDYTQRSSDAPRLLEVTSLGVGSVLLDGESKDSWNGELARALLFFLVDGGSVSRDDIFAALWPQLDVHEATNVFHVTKRKIADRLDELNITQFRSGVYQVAPNIELNYDVQSFLRAVEASAQANSVEEAEQYLVQALAFYRHDFLITLDTAWVRQRRQALRRIYSQALRDLANLLEKKPDINPQLLTTLRVRAAAADDRDNDLTAPVRSR